MVPDRVARSMRAVLGAPFGHVGIEVEDDAVTNVRLSDEPAEEDVPDGFPDHVDRVVRAYLDGRAPRPIAPMQTEGTPFQKRVWRALEDIPPGRTLTYGQMAKHLGKPGAARAVGQALRSNPLPLFRPCHRVTAKDGLGGFGGASEDAADDEGPLAVKRWLLAHERCLVER